MNDQMEEGNYCENRDSCGHEGDCSRRRVDKPDKVDASLAAKLSTVKQVE